VKVFALPATVAQHNRNIIALFFIDTKAGTVVNWFARAANVWPRLKAFHFRGDAPVTGDPKTRPRRNNQSPSGGRFNARAQAYNDSLLVRYRPRFRDTGDGG
jgi:hypothetical protein